MSADRNFYGSVRMAPSGMISITATPAMPLVLMMTGSNWDLQSNTIGAKVTSGECGSL
jgi:hypothetical protein